MVACRVSLPGFKSQLFLFLLLWFGASFLITLSFSLQLFSGGWKIQPSSFWGLSEIMHIKCLEQRKHLIAVSYYYCYYYCNITVTFLRSGYWAITNTSICFLLSETKNRQELSCSYTLNIFHTTTGSWSHLVKQPLLFQMFACKWISKSEDYHAKYIMLMSALKFFHWFFSRLHQGFCWTGLCLKRRLLLLIPNCEHKEFLSGLVSLNQLMWFLSPITAKLKFSNTH